MVISYTQKLILNSVSLVARSLVSFGSVFLAAQTMAPDQFYLITTGLIISLLVQTIADWGFNLTIYRERCSFRENQDQTLVAGKLGWSMLVALLAISILFLANTEEKMLFFVFIVIGLLQSYLNLLYMVSRAENHYAIEAVSQAIQCTLFVVGVSLINTSPNAIKIALVLFIPRVILMIVTIPNFRRFSLFVLPSLERFKDSIRSLKKDFLRVSSIGVFSTILRL